VEPRQVVSRLVTCRRLSINMLGVDMGLTAMGLTDRDLSTCHDPSAAVPTGSLAGIQSASTSTTRTTSYPTYKHKHPQLEGVTRPLQAGDNTSTTQPIHKEP
jgi:hypothetical protein